MELALGTVQFGMKYGIVGRSGPVPASDVRDIFTRAWDSGIRVIDTAPAYGDIEEHLNLLTANRSFKVVSKIPAIPDGLGAKEVEHFVTKSIQQSKYRLKEQLSTILFHRSEDLMGQHGAIAWNAAVNAISDSEIELGVSCYSPSEMSVLQDKFPICAVQIPGNALDQRLNATSNKNKVEIYLRSVFLQGILLDYNLASVRLPQVANHIKTWSKWCKENELTPLQAALSIVKSFTGVRYCVVGVDNLSHLEEILTAWNSSIPLSAPELATNNLDIIDPRRWLHN